MTSSLIEIGKNGRSIIWQPHLLTPAIRSLGLDDLLLEPGTDPTEVRAFVTENNGTSISWKWNAARRVEIFSTRNNNSALKTLYSNETPEISWNEVSRADDLELNFFGETTRLACIRLEVPELAHFGKGVEFGELLGGAVEVRLLNETDSTAFAIRLLGLRPNDMYREFAAPRRFSPGESRLRVPIPPDFYGLIVVVKSVIGRGQVVAYADFNPARRKPMPQNPRHGMSEQQFEKVRRWIEQAGDVGGHMAGVQTIDTFLDNWPAGARGRFRRIYELTRERLQWTETEILNALNRSLPGLFRYLVLVSCEYAASFPRETVSQLNASSFESALHRWRPELMNVLTTLTLPAEQVWAVSHADDQDLPAAAAAAGGQGLPALNRALYLLNKRREAMAAWEARTQARVTAAAT